MKNKIFLILLPILLAAGMLLFTSAVPTFAQGEPPGPDYTPVPTPIATTDAPVPDPGDAPEDGDSPNALQNIIQNITQVVHFPVPSITEALENVFVKAAAKEARDIDEEVSQWQTIFADVLSAPAEGTFTDITKRSLGAAGALAVALFLLRLAIHHWGNLAGDNEPLTTVFSDWMVAGMMAVVAGPFLDLFVRISWWMTGVVLGESSAYSLAEAFVHIISLMGISGDVVKVLTAQEAPSIFGILIYFALLLGAVLAIIGMVLAFAFASTALFVLAYLGPPIAVLAVLPQMRWLRALWIKAVSLIAILPFIAGAVFSAGQGLALFGLIGEGMLALLMRVLWLWGTAGFLLSVVGILGRITLATTTEALGKMAGAAQEIAGTISDGVATVGVGAAAVATGGASLGASAGVAGGAGAASGVGSAAGAAGFSDAGGAAGLSSAGGGSGIPGYDGLSQAQSHYQSAQGWNKVGAALQSMGMRGAAALTHSLGRGDQLAGRQAELGARMERMQAQAASDDDFSDDFPEFSASPSPGGDGGDGGAGNTGVVGPTGAAGLAGADVHASGGGGSLLGTSIPQPIQQRAQSTFSGSGHAGQAPQQMQAAYQGFSSEVAQKEGDRFQMSAVVANYPEDTGRMLQAYHDHPETINDAEQPMRQAAIIGGASQILQDAYGEELPSASPP